MTEIPEHLLKRSKQRRSAIGGGEGGDESAATPAAAAEGSADAPAAVAKAPAAPAPKAAEPPKPPPPVPPYIEAANRRRKIPVWAMPVLALLPVWAIIYANSMQEPPLGENDPIARGGALYESNCASCHGPTGAGGVGPALNNGAVLNTWPDAKDHIEWVKLGSTNWPGDTYGAQNKPKSGGNMPGFETQLEEEEILLIVRYERQEFGLEDPAEACKITLEIDPTSCDG